MLILTLGQPRQQRVFVFRRLCVDRDQRNRGAELLIHLPVELDEQVVRPELLSMKAVAEPFALAHSYTDPSIPRMDDVRAPEYDVRKRNASSQ
jgi:hypothetical protein